MNEDDRAFALCGEAPNYLTGELDNIYHGGLKVRDYVAIQAMNGMLASGEISLPDDADAADFFSVRAYLMADSMIKNSTRNERNNETSQK